MKRTKAKPGAPKVPVRRVRRGPPVSQLHNDHAQIERGYDDRDTEMRRWLWAEFQEQAGRKLLVVGRPGCGLWVKPGAMKQKGCRHWMSRRPRWQWDVRRAMPMVGSTRLPAREAEWEARYSRVAGAKRSLLNGEARAGGTQRDAQDTTFRLIERAWLDQKEEARDLQVTRALDDAPEGADLEELEDAVREAHPVPEMLNPKGTPKAVARAQYREARAVWLKRLEGLTPQHREALLRSHATVPRRGASRWQRDPQMWEQWGARSPWYGESHVGGVEIPRRRWFFLYEEDRVRDFRWQCWAGFLSWLVEG